MEQRFLYSRTELQMFIGGLLVHFDAVMVSLLSSLQGDLNVGRPDFQKVSPFVFESIF